MQSDRGRPRALRSTKRAGIAARPRSTHRLLSGSGVDDRDDLERRGIDHDDLVADQEELIAAPIRIDR